MIQPVTSAVIKMISSKPKKYAFGIILLAGLLFAHDGSGKSQPSATPSAPSSKERSLAAQADRFIELGQQTEAIQTLERFLVTYPKSLLLPDILIKLGDVLVGQGDLEKAVEAFHDFLKKFPSDVRAPTVRAALSTAHIQMGSVEAALGVWDNITGEETLKFPIYNRALEIYTEREAYPHMLRVLVKKDKILEEPSEVQSNRDALLAIIHHRLSEKELQEVVSEFAPAFPADEADIRLIRMYDTQEVYHLAEKEIKQFLTLFTHHPYTVEAQETLETIREKIKGNRYRMAVLLPLSGTLSSFGESALHGIQLALWEFKEALPGIPVALAVWDSNAPSEAGTKTLESWLYEYKPIGIVGPLRSQDVETLAPLAAKGGWAVITPGAAAETLPLQGEAVFRNAATLSSQCQSLSEYAVQALHVKRMAILAPEGPSGQKWVTCMTQAITQRGGKIAVVKSYSRKTVDFKAQILHLKNVFRKKSGDGSPGFDALFLPGDARRAGLIIPQLTFHSVKDVALLGTMAWNDPEFLKLAGSHAEGAIFIDGFFVHSPDPLVQSFVQRYRKQFQQEPDLFAAQAYDAAQLILTAIRQGASNPSSVRRAIAETMDFPAVSGYIYEMHDGEARKKPFFIQIKKGQLIQID